MTFLSIIALLVLSTSNKISVAATASNDNLPVLSSSLYSLQYYRSRSRILVDEEDIGDDHHASNDVVVVVVGSCLFYTDPNNTLSNNNTSVSSCTDFLVMMYGIMTKW